MTRKDYVMISNAIAATRARASLAGQKAIDSVAISLANEFEADNPRFDATRFVVDCNVNLCD